MAGHNSSIAQYGRIRRLLQWPYAPRTTIAATRRLPVVRYASSSSTSDKPNKTRILEKPAKFNPPSHGSRLPKSGARPRQQHYGGDLSDVEVKVQNTKDYPGLMAPVGSLAYRMWHSKALHLCITMGTLFSLAAFTFVQNFKHNSPFYEMVPSWSDFFWHPIMSVRQLVNVVKLSEAHQTAIVHEKRMIKVNDVAKRKEYKKAHGLDITGLPWLLGKTEEAQVDAASEAPPTPAGSTSDEEGKVPRKKWLGIF